MTHVHQLLAAGPTISFEFFPPRSPEAADRLQQTLHDLEPLHPSFVSVTYGAGGSTRDATRTLVEGLLTTPLNPMAHVTAVSHTRDELTDILRHYHQVGVHNLMLLRGDAPSGGESAFWELEHAADLVQLARDIGGSDVSIGVAAHPEGHPQSPDLASDRDHLAKKLQIADFGVTQFFFESALYTRLVDDLAERGCTRPVIPGIMPVTNVRQIARFAELSGAAFPTWLAARLDAAEDADDVRRIGIDVATELCLQLLEAGAPGLHFYTLNHSTATREIFGRLCEAGALPSFAQESV